MFLRALMAVGGAIAAYGTTGMFTTAGVMPPNAIVIAGLVACGAAGLALWSSERSLTGAWTALLIAGVPFALYGVGAFGRDECPQPHPPLGPTYTCAPVGSHALAVIALAVALLGFAALALDLRALTRALTDRPRGS